MTDLLALAELVEQLIDGGSIDAAYLDRDILRAVLDPDAELLDAPNYCASLDAAMTLVPEGARFVLDSDGCHARISKPSDVDWPWNGFAALAGTPALALVAASLRARHAQQENSHAG